MPKTILIDSMEIPLEIILSDRKTNSIIVMPDLKIVFRGNVNTIEEDIEFILQKKLNLISKKIKFFEQFQPQPTEHNYESGETLYYLGRQYRLKLLKAEYNRVRLMGRWFIVECKDTSDKKRVKILLEKWFREKAIRHISERYKANQALFRNRITCYPELSFRKMKKRWGSCSSKRILINTELIKTSMICIDYILVHELCHLLYKKHDKAFYNRLTRLMPDWRQRKDRLEHANIS